MKIFFHLVKKLFYDSCSEHKFFLFIDLICHWYKPSFVNLNFPLWDIHQRWRWASGNCSEEFWLETRGNCQVSRNKTKLSADFKMVQGNILLRMVFCTDVIIMFSSFLILLQTAWSEETNFSENCQLWTFWKRGISLGEGKKNGVLVF